jgi:hypothetical protein
MALEDFVDPEVGVAVAATALVLSPKVRATVRRGLVVGLASVMKAAGSVGDAARNVAGEAQDTMSTTVAEVRATANQPRTTNSRTSKTTAPAEK